MEWPTLTHDLLKKFFFFFLLSANMYLTKQSVEECISLIVYLNQSFKTCYNSFREKKQILLSLYSSGTLASRSVVLAVV